ncbi:hypothetical protein LRP88_11201 [Fusarium phalaenopsidis]
MAEALGVVGSVIGIIQITATVALRLNSLVQGIRDAPDDIRHLQDDVANLAAVLDTTHELSEQYQHVEAPSLTRALKGQLGTCEKSMQDIRTFLNPLVQKALGGNKFIRMVEWNLKKSELRDLRGRLSEGKAGLNLTITSLHGYLEGKKLDEIKSDIGQLYEKIMSDFKDIVRGEEFRKQIEKDVDNDSVRDGQSDAGFVMRNFIDQTPVIGYPDQGAGASSTSDTLAGGDDLFNMDNPEAMLDAVRSQNKQYVRALISRGVGLTGRSKQGFTVLHYCAFDNDVAMGQLLIKNGAQLNTKDFHLRSPLRLALSLPSYGFAELLVDRADPNHVLRTSNREIVLIGVCANHFLGVARELLKAGANPNHASNDGRNAMYWALYCGNVELFKLLVQNGGDVNYRWQHDECTLVMMAAERGNMDILRVLMDAGADVGGQNKNGETALGLAQQKNKKQAVELLQKTAQQGAGRDTKGPVTPFRLQGSYTKQATIS